MIHSNEIAANLATRLKNEVFQKKSLTDSEFTSIALDIFAYQFRNIPLYRSYCEQVGRNLEQVTDWKDIPALPTEAFKRRDHPIAAQACQHHFLTSGTTGEIRGRHHFPELETYEHSIMGAWALLGLPSKAPFVFLSQGRADAPHSSLVHMMDTLDRHQPETNSCFLIDGDGNFQLDPLESFLKQHQPVCLFGTALAFLNLMEQNENSMHLPAGSSLIETGGYKGSGRDLEKVAFYQQLGEFFGIETERIWNEYSMTELSSQTYTQGLGQPHQSPPWLKVQILDPETRKPVPEGATGIIVLHDLANLHSCAAIETQDLGIYHDAHHFTLLGRDPGALPRGCSRASDQLLRS